MQYFIHFYNRKTGGLSRKEGYKRVQDAEKDLRKNRFAPEGEGVWLRDDYIARIKLKKDIG